MEITLSESEYQDFLLFKLHRRAEEMEKVRQSLLGRQSLYDDIDAPMRRIIAALSLLGLETVFSCCGFDYQGQPYHKSHQYGLAYVTLKQTETAAKFFLPGQSFHGWNVTANGDILHLNLNVFSNPAWRNQSSIHFSEELVIGIQALENRVLRNDVLSLMSDECVLNDSNHSHLQSLRGWQYPPTSPWIIRKADLFTY